MDSSESPLAVISLNEILSGKQAFRALSVFDIGVRSEPLDNLSIAVQRQRRTERKPTIHAIETA
jgi:hypothetical protein